MPTKRTKIGVTLERMRELALRLPGTSERPSYGTPGFRAFDKLFARVLPNGDSIVVAVTFEQRETLLASLPGVFSLTPHYERYPWVIVRLAAIDESLLCDLLEEGERFAASTAPRRNKKKRPTLKEEKSSSPLARKLPARRTRRT
jgi:hypothetical protein